MQRWEIKHRWTGAVLYAGDGETLRDAVVAAVDSHADLRGADLLGADLSGADLLGANLRDADLSDADLSGAHLGGANLDGANLGGANLGGANLGGANLGGANLGGANLRDADLSGAYLRDADLRGADLGYNKLIGASPILMIGPIGSRSDYLTAYITDNGVMVRTGCFFGSLDKFRAAVAETHGDSNHGREYAAAISLIETHAAIWTPAVETAKEGK